MKKHDNEKKYWEEYWQKEARQILTFLFSDILKKYKIEPRKYFEIGCAPGSIMTYINQVYGAYVSGLDLVDKSIIEKFLNHYNIQDYTIFEGDINQFVLDEKFDFVGSYGFIEHFENPEEIIKKHKDLVSDDGYLCITVPNMRYFNYLFNLIFSKELLETHNLSIMDLKKLKSIILDEEFEKVYASYYLTSMFQANKDSQRLKEHRALSKIYEIVNKIMEILKIDNIPNRYFSPYIIVVAKKCDKQKIYE